MPGSTKSSAQPTIAAAWDLYPATTPRQLYHNLAEQTLIDAHALPPGDDAYIQTLDAAHLAVETVLALLGVPEDWRTVLTHATGDPSCVKYPIP